MVKHNFFIFIFFLCSLTPCLACWIMNFIKTKPLLGEFLEMNFITFWKPHYMVSTFKLIYRSATKGSGTINLINLEEIFWKRSISAAGNALFSRERSSNLPKRSITGPSQFPFFCEVARLTTARSFFWRQKVRFWGKTFVTEVQKSFICPIKDRFGLQPEFINEPFVALRYWIPLLILENTNPLLSPNGLLCL